MKHKSTLEWIYWFLKIENGTIDWNEYFGTINNKPLEASKAKARYKRKERYKVQQAKFRLLAKYKLWKKDDNSFMTREEYTIALKDRKKEIDDFVKGLTREQLEELARLHIVEQEINKKKKSSINKNLYEKFNVTELAIIFNIHRTTFYKKPKQREYKFDKFVDEIKSSFNSSNGVYGRLRLSVVLEKQNIVIPERTLGRLMKRHGLITKIRKKRRWAEHKNTSVHYEDLVQRNFNPASDNIVATDVTYIPANEEQNFVYLSVAISHKTKLIEAKELSILNNADLVLDTLKQLKRKNFIIHSDHGSQYSCDDVVEYNKLINAQISMSRVGNSLDNREVEYFFSCLKSERLNMINTSKMKIDEIKEIVLDYIEWYNNKRIQKRLHWQTPNEVWLMQSNM